MGVTSRIGAVFRLRRSRGGDGFRPHPAPSPGAPHKELGRRQPTRPASARSVEVPHTRVATSAVERLRENAPNAPIEVPLLIAQGLSDVVIDPSVNDAYVKERCAAG